MITILSSPGDLSGAKNPMVIKAQTDSYITSAGTKASLVLNFDGIPAAGDSFTIEFGDFSETFTSSATPDDSGLEFYSNNNGPHIPTQSLEDYVDTLAAELTDLNYYLRRDYDITSSYDIPTTTATLLFTAKETGTAHNINSATQSGTWPAATPKIVVAGSNTTYNSNFTLQCAIEFEYEYGSDVYTRVLTLSLYPNADSEVVFYLDGALYAVLKKDSNNFNLPGYGQSTLSQADKIARRYRASLVEWYGDTPEPHKMQAFASVVALYGGLNPIEYPDVNFLSYFTTNKKFLSFDPSVDSDEGKVITTVQHEYLYFPVFFAADFTLFADVYYTDGTSSLDNALLTQAVATYCAVYICPAGYTQLDIGSISPLKTVSYYDLKMKNVGGSPISELRRYRITYKENYRTRYFLFLNSLGAYETLRVTGVREFNPRYSDNVTEHLLQHDYEVPDGQYESLGRSTNMQYTCATGYYSKAYINHLAREFQNSERVYLVSEETGGDPPGFYIPVILLDTEQLADVDDQTLSALQFKYRLAYDFAAHSKVWDVLS